MDPERVKRWWRVVINKAGNVTECETVENCERNTRTVLYIRAACSEHAQAAAHRWLERRRAKARAYERRRFLAAKKKGVCITCGTKRAATSEIYCATHLAQTNAASKRRAEARKHRAPQTPTPIDPVVVLARTQARHQRYQRMLVSMQVILAVFDQVDGRLSSPYRQWLVDEITQRGGAREAAE